MTPPGSGPTDTTQGSSKLTLPCEAQREFFPRNQRFEPDAIPNRIRQVLSEMSQEGNGPKTDLSPNRLVPVALPARLKYVFLGYKGALSRAYLQEDVALALQEADRKIRCQSGGRIRILVWDALRTHDCQRDIWNRYAQQVSSDNPGLSREELNKRVGTFVSSPEGVFRHGTGGAVDVTLLLDGQEMEMGTAFDEFSPRAAADYFRNNTPKTSRDIHAHINRETLRSAMETAGFTVLPEEWWHFELGTEMWASARARTPFLTKVILPPDSDRYPAEALIIDKGLPTLVTGVAPAFSARSHRDSALEGRTSAHYYARNSTPSRTVLEQNLQFLFKTKSAISTSSGMAACLTTARAVLDRRTTIFMADTVYYEVALRLKREAEFRDWIIKPFDPTRVTQVLRDIGQEPEDARLALWIDQPSNWWLNVTDFGVLAKAIKQRGGIVIADISVHPLVPILSQGADIAVLSLSKFPSNGLALGGVALTNDSRLADLLLRQRAHDTSVLSAESAFQIDQQLISLLDRFAAVSSKAERLAFFARSLPGVLAVRYPDPAELGTDSGGGVFVLELSHSRIGEIAEEIIRQNFCRPDFPPVLACTFGSARTTLEHFQPRGSANDEVVGVLTRPLPANFCRVGVGCERIDEIRAALELAFPQIVN